MAQQKKALAKSKASSPKKLHVPYILLVEDEPAHAAAIRHAFRSAKLNVAIKTASSLQGYRSAIAASLPDIVLMDINLPDGKAFEILTAPPESGLFPIVVMTSYGDEKIAVKAMKAGALDYVVKSSEAFTTMPRVVVHALGEWKLMQERKRAEKALSESEERFRSLYENVAVGLYRTTPAGKILLANRTLVKMLGYSSFEQLAERNLAKVGFTQSSQRKVFLRNIEMEGEITDFESAWTRQDGSLVIVRENARAIRDPRGKTLYYDGAVEDITERRLAEVASRHAENALRESEEKFRFIAENFHDVLFITDTKGIITYISQAANHIFGYKSEDMKGRYFSEYLDETELLRIMPVFENAIRMGTPTKNLTVLAKRKNGKTFYGEIDTSIIIKDGKVQGTSGVIRDISERKRAEEALRESENRLKSIILVAPTGIGTVSNRIITEANVRLCEMTGYQRDELIGQSARILYPTQKEFEYVGTEKYEQIAEKGTGTVETHWKRKDGSIINVLLSSTPIDLADLSLGVTFTALDITERKQAGEALRQSEDKFRHIFESANVGKSITLPTGEINVNQAFCDMLGYSQEELRNKKWQEITHAEEIESTQKIIDPLLMGEKNSARFNKRYIHKNGSTVWADISIVLQRDADRIPKYFITTVMDITERKQAEEALRESETKRQIILESINEIIYSTEQISPDSQQSIITFVSSRLEEKIGVQPDELLHDANLWFSLVHPEDRFILSDQTAIIFNTKQPGIRIYRIFNKKTGNYLWVEDSVFPKLDEKGRIIATFGVAREITERKRAEEALQQSHDMIVKLTAQVPGVVYQYRLYQDGRSAFPFASHGMNDIYEVTPEDVRKDATLVFGRLHKDDSDHVVASIQESARTLMPFHCEFRVVLPRQGLRWRLSDALPERMEDGSTLWHGIISDITERKQAEEALQQSESQFRELWGATVEGITILDNGIIIEVNDAMCQMFGYTRDYVIGKSLLDFSPIEMRDRIRERIATGIEGRFETPALRADGTRIILETFAKRIVYQGKPVRLVTTRDITNRMRAEEDIRKLSSAVEQSGSSIVITNLKGEIEYVNPKFVELTGYSAQEVIGKNPRILKSGQTSSEEYKNLWNIITDGQVWRGEFQNKKKNGKLYWESATVSPVKDSSGKITHFIAVKEDITQQRTMEEQLRQMQKLEGLGTLAGGIAHDFNNILGIILAYITSIKRFKDDTKKLDLATETITKAVQRGKTLVQQILTFARKTVTEFEPVNINDVVAEIMMMILETFPKILTYEQNVDKDISFINADRSQLHQALLNLCVNARDAMQQGGVLTISTRMISSVNLRTQHPDASASSYVCIEVCDTGEGMTEETRERIFEPFFTTKGIGKGTGLGLAVVFGVVQNHKGFIDVESELGKGTIFRLFLPATQAPEPAYVNEKEVTMEEIVGGKETLLVVEDEEMLMMSLRMVLVEKGYTVLSASDGLTALKIYQERKNDIALVLTDLGLPTITGLEVCQRIKKINPNEHMVLATGFLDPEMKSEFLKAGIQYFLYKPYDLKKVLKVIREVLDRK